MASNSPNGWRGKKRKAEVQAVPPLLTPKGDAAAKEDTGGRPTEAEGVAGPGKSWSRRL